jgi:hypothetical protein
MDLSIYFELPLKYYAAIIVILLVFYLFLRWGLRFFFDSAGIIKGVSISLIVILGIVLLQYSMVVTIFYGQEWKDKKFDKHLWDSSRVERYTMAKDLVDSRRLISKDTHYLKLLLGEPEEGKQGEYWIYDMGGSGS